MNDTQKGLLNFLENENNVASSSKEIWGGELEAFRQLGDLFLELDKYSRPVEGHLTQHEQISHIMLLTVQHQMFSVVSQLLRTNKNDALALTRRAIEATAIAHRIWGKPSLVDTFLTAYPHIGDDHHSKQWMPGNKYDKAFKTKELFSPTDPILKRLGTIYETICAGALHAGPSVLLNLRSQDGKTYLVANEADPEELDKWWCRLLLIYLDAIRIFFEILGEKLKPEGKQWFEKKLEIWVTETKSKVKYQPWVNVEPTS